MHTSAPPHPRSLSALLPSELASAKVARRLVDELLDDCDLDPDVVHDAELVVTELVANAVLHGRPDHDDSICVSCALEASTVVLSVHDDGRAGEVAAASWSDERTSGRGLVVVDGLSESWSVDRSAGTTVTARLAARTRTPQPA